MMLKLYSEQKRHLAKQVCVCLCLCVCVRANFALLMSCSCTKAVEVLYPTYASKSQGILTVADMHVLSATDSAQPSAGCARHHAASAYPGPFEGT